MKPCPTAQPKANCWSSWSKSWRPSTPPSKNCTGKAEAAATEAVEKAEAKLDNLSTQGAVNSANSAYISASTLVNKLHSGEVRDALKKRPSVIKGAINDAQKEVERALGYCELGFSRQVLHLR